MFLISFLTFKIVTHKRYPDVYVFKCSYPDIYFKEKKQIACKHFLHMTILIEPIISYIYIHSLARYKGLNLSGID